jgi:hypothetical protein
MGNMILSGSSSREAPPHDVSSAHPMHFEAPQRSSVECWRSIHFCHVMFPKLAIWLASFGNLANSPTDKSLPDITSKIRMGSYAHVERKNIQ